MEGLWHLKDPVTAEDIRHMQSRVIQFDALVPVEGQLREIPLCAEPWRKWIVEASAANAVRQIPAQPAALDDEDL